MLLSIGLNFSFLSLSVNKFGQVFMLFIMTLASAESSLGLALLVVLYRLKQVINFESFISLDN
jgi:NADH:ubiquinone oxidoreductase subunit K